MKALGVIPGVENSTALIDHVEIRKEIVLVVKILTLHSLMKPFHSSVLLGTIGIRKVVRYACLLQFLVEIQKILTPVIRVDSHDGEWEEGLKLSDKISP